MAKGKFTVLFLTLLLGIFTLAHGVEIAVTAPNQTIGAGITQDYFVNISHVVNLQGFDISIKFPKADFATAPTNLTIGPLFQPDFSFSYDNSDGTNWIYNVVCTKLGPPSITTTGDDAIVLFSYSATSTEDYSNQPVGCDVEVVPSSVALSDPDGMAIALDSYTDLQIYIGPIIYPVNNVTQTLGYNTIHEAIAAAATGDHITIAGGEYLEPKLNIYQKSLTLQGLGTTENPTVVKRDPYDTVGSYFWDVNGAPGTDKTLTVKNLTIDVSGNTETEWFVAHISHLASATLENVTLIGQGKDYTTDGAPYYYTGPGNTNVVGGLDFILVGAVSLTNVTVTGNGRNGISCSDVPAIALSGITVEDCGNSASTGWAGLAVYTQTAASAFTLAGTNSIDNVPIGILAYPGVTLPTAGSIAITNALVPFAAANLPASDAFAHNIIAHDYKVYTQTGTNAGQASYYPTESAATAIAVLGSLGTDKYVVENLVTGVFSVVPGMSIQAAINAAAANDVILVAGGTYDESLNIAGKSNLAITGLGTRELTTLKPSTVIPWNYFGYTTGRRSAIRIVESTNINFQNLVLDCDLIKNNGWHGVFYANSTGSVFNNCTFKNLYIDQAHYGDVMIYSRAITPFTPDARATLSLQYCNFIDTGRVGLVTHDYLSSVINYCNFYKTTDSFGYGMEIGSSSIAAITNNLMYGFDTAAVSDGSTSAAIYIENAFTSAQVTPAVTKNVSISGNEIHSCQSAITVGNQFNGYAGNVDMVVSIATNNIHDTLLDAVLVTDEDKSAGSSVTVTMTGNTIANPTFVPNSSGIFMYSVGDGDLDLTMTGNTISGFDDGLVAYDYGTNPLTSFFNLSATNTNTFINNKTAVFVGNVNWETAPAFSGNVFTNNNPINFDASYDVPLSLNLAAILSGNTYDRSILVDQVIYRNAAILYVQAPNELIKDNELQVYSVKVADVTNLRGFTVQIKIPAADFNQPNVNTDFAIGQGYTSHTIPGSLMPVLYSGIIVDPDTQLSYYTYDVSGTYLFGGPTSGITGSDKELFKVTLTSLTDRDNIAVPGCNITLPLTGVIMYDANNPIVNIPCAGTLPEFILIDATEPVFAAIPQIPGQPLPTFQDPVGAVDPTFLTLSVSDNYNLDYVMYLIQPAGTDPTTIAQFSSSVVSGITGAAWNNGGANWEIPNDVLNGLAQGEHEIFFLAVDDAGNFTISPSWNFIIDTLPPDPIVWWTEAQAVGDFSPCRTSVNANNSIDLKWTNPAGTVKVQIWRHCYGDDTTYPEYGLTGFTLPAAPNPYLASDPNGWVRLTNEVTGTTYTDTSMPRGYYYYTLFAEDASGNLSAAPAAPFYRESISYWPGDVEANYGAVDPDDIARLSVAWGATPTNGLPWNNLVDVGPSTDYARRSRPVPDNVINIHDMMMFAMNYNNTDYSLYYRQEEEETAPIAITLNAVQSGETLTLTLLLADNGGNLRGLNIPIRYGSGLSLQGYEAGEIWPETSLMLHTDADRVVTLSGAALGAEATVAGDGVIATVTFAITGADDSFELMRMLAFSEFNHEIEIVNNPTGNVDNDDLVNVIPESSYLGSSYPNPFRGSTTLTYGVKEAGGVRVTVFNSRGQLIRSLVNDSKAPGTYQIVWDGRDDSGQPASSGIYFFRLETKGLVKTHKALMLK